MNNFEQIKSQLKKQMSKVYEHNTQRVYIDIKPSDLVSAAEYIFSLPNIRFAIASGMDTSKGIEILYHFSDDSTGQMISLRVLLTDKKNPEIDTLSKVIKGASWIEREMHELLGVNFIGHKNLKHLILPEDWPEGDYPLRQKEREN